MSETPDLTPDELAHLDQMRSLANELTSTDAALDTPPPNIWAAIEQGVT